MVIKHNQETNAAQLSTSEIDLTEWLWTFWRSKLLLGFAVIIFVLLGYCYSSFVLVPKYTSTTVIVLQGDQNSIVNFDSVVSGIGSDQSAINTEVEIIRSRTLIGKLVDTLDLVNDPEFNSDLIPVSKFSISNLITAVTGKEPTRVVRTADQIREAAINAVLARIDVRNVRSTLIFNISATTEDPQKSAKISNSLSDLYIQEQIEVKFSGTEQATEWLTSRVSELKVELEQVESEAKSFASQSDLVSAEALDSINKQIKDLRDRRADLAEQIDNLKIVRSIQQNAFEKQDAELISRLTDDVVLDQEFPKVLVGDVFATQNFWNRVETILTQSEIDLNRSNTQIFTLDQSIKTLETQSASQSKDLVRLQQLQREAEASRLIYEYFLGRLKETSVQKGIQQADSRILSLGVAPGAPSAPNRPIILMIFAIVGFGFSAAFVIIKQLLNTKIRRVSDLEKLTGENVIGQIPCIPARKRLSVLQYLIDKPNSVVAEAVRNLRTSIMLSDVDNPPQIVMSTSSLPGEGKTTQSLALTLNFSGLGKKVLLVEGDIRRRVFSEYFNVENKGGLLAVLSGEMSLSEAVSHVDMLGADVLTGEKSKLNAADIFSSNSFKSFLEKARKTYDIIIIDTPPVLIVPDARVIGQSVDAIVYTVKWDSSTKNNIRDGLRMFEQVNLKVSGLVLSQIDQSEMGQYGDSYSGNYYDN